jgi:hypothetical protein
MKKKKKMSSTFVNNGRLIEIFTGCMYPEVWDPYYESSMLRCIQIGLLCVQELPRERPNISTVVLMLISEITHLPPPGKVAFRIFSKMSAIF